MLVDFYRPDINKDIICNGKNHDKGGIFHMLLLPIGFIKDAARSVKRICMAEFKECKESGCSSANTLIKVLNNFKLL